MSSSDDSEFSDRENVSAARNQSAKKRKTQRACDMCRRKKIRCDALQKPSSKCTSCTENNFECTYLESAKTLARAPPKRPRSRYVDALEQRLEKMEKLLTMLAPDGNFAQELGGIPENPSQQVAGSSSAISPAAALLGSHGIKTLAFDTDSDSPPPDSESDEDFSTRNMVKGGSELAAVDLRYFGKSSGVRLVQTALELKYHYHGHEVTKASFLSTRRLEYWEAQAWETPKITEVIANYVFPEPDLLTSLIDIYFTIHNTFLPLLHRPTFEREMAAGKHLWHVGFGGTVLLVCALASRSSKDPRVILPETGTTRSSGWKYFDQVHAIRTYHLASPSLYDLQNYSLAVMYMQGGSKPQRCWSMCGTGIRLAQDVGANRRKMYPTSRKPTVDDELWKRAFWVLVALDRPLSASLGRSTAIQDEDFDVDFPLEVDDEYWENPLDPERAFVQPPDKPSTASFFVSYLRLNQILGFILRTIYSVNKSRNVLGFRGPNWEQQIVIELDSALNKWIDTLPDHLRWDPHRANPIFFKQSALLHMNFYHLQLLIHRPFIATNRKPSPLSFPSLAICTNAARASVHVIDLFRKRKGLPFPIGHFNMMVFQAGVVLLLNIWGGKQSGIGIDVDKAMAEVHKCMLVLKSTEDTWQVSGRLWDGLSALVSLGKFPQPPNLSNKRERDSDTPLSTPSPPSRGSDTAVLDGPRIIAGSRRVSPKDNSLSPASSASPQLHTPLPSFEPLPMYSDDLGRLPIPMFEANGVPLSEANNAWYPTIPNNNFSLPGEPGPSQPSLQTFPPNEEMFFNQMDNRFSTFPQNQTDGSKGQNLYSMTDASASYQPHLPADPNSQAGMDLWGNAPFNLESDMWDSFMSELTQGQQRAV